MPVSLFGQDAESSFVKIDKKNTRLTLHHDSGHHALQLHACNRSAAMR